MANPAGPIAGFDPEEPAARKRVQRGGSFLCNDAYCGAFRPGFRGKGEISSAASHVGFRCVRSRRSSIRTRTQPFAAVSPNEQGGRRRSRFRSPRWKRRLALP